MIKKDKTILILDTDEILLASLKRLLRQQRREWEVLTFTSGDMALRHLKENPADAVITDVILQDMDGITFLRALKRAHPSIIRIVAASRPEEGHSMASGGEAHQYLQKPFDSQILIGLLERSFEMREILRSHKIRNVVARISNIPSMPQFYLELIEKLNDPNASSKDIGRLIQRDPGMSAKVLQLVNSAFFGLYGKVADPVRAVTVLGTETIKALALTYGVFKQINPKKVEACRMNDFWHHNLYVASLTKALGMKECLLDTICQGDVFTSGILHDIGKLLFVDNLTKEYAKLMSELKGPLVEAEIEEFGCHHGEVGAYLLSLWGLPDKIVEAVLWHHGPIERLIKAGIVPSLVWLADRLVNKVTKKEQYGKSLEEVSSLIGIQGDLTAYEEFCQRLVEGGPFS